MVRSANNDKGSALAIAVSMVFLFGAMGIGTIEYGGGQNQYAAIQAANTRAFWLADAGLQEAASMGCNINTISNIPVAFGSGTYTVSGTNPIISTGTVKTNGVSRILEATCTAGSSTVPGVGYVQGVINGGTAQGTTIYSNFTNTTTTTAQQEASLSSITIPNYAWSSTQCVGGVSSGQLTIPNSSPVVNAYTIGLGGNIQCYDFQLSVPSPYIWHITGNLTLYLTNVAGTSPEDLLRNTDGNHRYIQIDAAPYIFQVSGVTTAPAVGAAYTNNGTTYTVIAVPSLTAGAGQLVTTVTSTITNSVMPIPSLSSGTGTLTLSSGTGQSSIAFTADYNVIFQVSGTLPTAGATYTNNGVTYTVTSTSQLGGGEQVYAIGNAAPLASGTLTEATGSGPGTIIYSSFSSYNIVFQVSGVTTPPAVGATYTSNGNTYTVTGTFTGTSGQVFASSTGTGALSSSGTLTNTSGTGDATVSYSSFTSQFPSLTIYADGRVTEGDLGHDGNTGSLDSINNTIQAQPNSNVIYSLYGPYAFQVSGTIATVPTAGATYTHNSVTYTVKGATTVTTGPVQVYAIGSARPLASGTLTKVSGTGTSPINFSGYVNYNTVFQVSNITTPPSVGATYTNNGITYTVITTSLTSVSGKYVGQIFTIGNDVPNNSGTLTRTGGTGDNSIAFSSYVDPGNGVEENNYIDGSGVIAPFYGVIYAPYSQIEVNDTELIYGSIIGNAIDFNLQQGGNTTGTTVHADPSLSTSLIGGSSSGILTNWEECTSINNTVTCN